MPKEEKDMVNHPDHYQTESGLEVITVIEAFSLGYKAGSAIKYILRAGKKGDYVEDLEKARTWKKHVGLLAD